MISSFENTEGMAFSMKKRKKSIGIVNAYNETAGPFTVLKTFLSHYRNEDVPIVLFIPKGPKALDFPGNNVRIVYTQTLPIDKDIFSFRIFRYLVGCIAGFFRFLYFYKKYNVGLVHNNSSNLLIPSLAAQASGVKIVYHIREAWNTRNRLSKILYHYIAHASAKIVCISNTALYANFTEKQRQQFAGKLTTIADCIDVESYQRKTIQKDTERVIVSFVGRIAPIKGLDILVKAFELLAVQQGIKDVELRIIGDIPKDNAFYRNYKKQILESVDKCRNVANAKIEMLGFRDDVAELLLESHVLILPSRIEEGLGLVLIEGAVAENFVITSNFGGQKEIIEAIGSGFLFENENAQDLASKLGLYLSRRSQLTGAVQSARANALSLYSPARYQQSLLSLYSEILKNEQ